MAYYIKVTSRVAETMGLTAIRNKTADGNYLLWQADVSGVEGDTILERAQKVGGVALTPQQAREETDGVSNPAQVFTPAEYGGEETEGFLPEEESLTDETMEETKDEYGE